MVLGPRHYQVYYQRPYQSKGHAKGQPDGALSGAAAALRISQRVGNIPRRITLHNQSIFETEQNDAVDRWIASNRKQPGSGSILHNLESRWRWIIPSLILVSAICFAGVKWGLPWTSKVLARNVSDQVVQQISANAMSVLDKLFFQPSEIPPVRQRELEKQFYLLLHSGGLNTEYGIEPKLSFRKSGVANAFALPSEEIIVADEFFRLVDNQNQINSVFLHEIGHVIHAHGLQQIIHSAIVSFLVAMIAGDPSGLEELFAGLQAFMLQSHYSREHEIEADRFALEFMLANGIDPYHFAEALEKIDPSPGGRKDATPEEETISGQPHMDKSNAAHSGAESRSLPDYFSSHPATVERIQTASPATYGWFQCKP